MRRPLAPGLFALALLAAALAGPAPAALAQAPRHGGELVFVVGSEMPSYDGHRVVPHNARVRGWTITPSHYLNGQLDTVWLAPE